MNVSIFNKETTTCESQDRSCATHSLT